MFTFASHEFLRKKVNRTNIANMFFISSRTRNGHLIRDPSRLAHATLSSNIFFVSYVYSNPIFIIFVESHLTPSSDPSMNLK